MKKIMCEQIKVLKKVRKAGEMNGYSVELAEATAKDYITMKARLDNIESDVSAIKTEQAVQGGKLDLIIRRLNSPVEKERLDGQKWNLLTSIAKHKSAWVILIIMLVAFALAGDRLVTILERLI